MTWVADEIGSYSIFSVAKDSDGMECYGKQIQTHHCGGCRWDATKSL